MNKIKAIIFDYDGVIVNSFPSIFEIYKEICEEFKLYFPNSITEFRRIYGYSYQECLKNLGIKGENINRANEIFRTRITEKKHNIFNGIKDVIIILSKKYKLFLVSSTYKNEILSKINDNNLKKYFQEIYGKIDKKIKKDKIIKDILKNHNLSNKEIVSIGDRTVDYDVAKKINLDDDNIIIVDYGWGYNKEKVKIDNIAYNPNDILKILNKK